MKPTAVPPPHSPEAERGVLGAILLDAGRVLAICGERGVTETWFHIPAHRTVFSAIIAVSNDSRQVVDSLTVRQELRRTGTLHQLGSDRFLDDLIDATPTAVHAEHYLGIVAEQLRLRRILHDAREAARQVADGRASNEIIADTEARLLQFPLGDHSDPTTEEIATEIQQSWTNAADGNLATVPSSFAELNDVLGGYGEYTVLAGRPGQGKSTLMLNDAFHQASQGYPVGIASLEMSTAQCLKRMACNLADVPLFVLNHGRGTREQLDAALAALGAIVKLPLFISDRSHTPDTLGSWARRAKMKHDIAVLYVDYLQILAPARRYAGLYDQVSDFSRSTLALRKQLGIPVVALSQLSREPSKYKKPRPPKLSDLRDSGAIEQDAHTVMFVYDHPEKGHAGESIVSVEKNRDGPLGDVVLRKVFNRQRFEDQSRDKNGDREAQSDDQADLFQNGEQEEGAAIERQ